MSQILVPRFRPPRVITAGVDTIPDYIVAARDSPHFYHPPAGFNLTIWLGEERLWHIVEADRRRGFAKGLVWEWSDVDQSRRVISHDENGIAQHRDYYGNIVFKLVPRGG